jgi:hypothetical protein
MSGKKGDKVNRGKQKKKRSDEEWKTRRRTRANTNKEQRTKKEATEK